MGRILVWLFMWGGRGDLGRESVKSLACRLYLSLYAGPQSDVGSFLAEGMEDGSRGTMIRTACIAPAE